MSLHPRADINECSENLSICGEKVCENTYGTYTCTEPLTSQPPTTEPSTTTTTATIVVTSTSEVSREDDRASDVDEVEKSEDEDEESESESEIGKQREDIDESHETRQEEIDMDGEVTGASSTSEIITEPTTTTTEMSNEISGQVKRENYTDEDCNVVDGTSSSIFTRQI